MSDYKDPLPDGCPPLNATEVEGIAFFRLVSTFPPTLEEFMSAKVLNPNRRFQDECAARALSVCASQAGAADLLKLPTQRGKLIARLDLGSGAGRHKQTGNRSYHHSWWLYRDFDPLPCCSQVDEGGGE